MIDYIDIAETLNYYLDNKELEDEIMEDLHIKEENKEGKKMKTKFIVIKCRVCKKNKRVKILCVDNTIYGGSNLCLACYKKEIIKGGK